MTVIGKDEGILVAFIPSSEPWIEKDWAEIPVYIMSIAVSAGTCRMEIQQGLGNQVAEVVGSDKRVREWPG